MHAKLYIPKNTIRIKNKADDSRFIYPSIKERVFLEDLPA
jgi:hypothetical protein